ncbi:MAG: BrnT family toxin [bacterium]|nr:BrnT family toxin [bacterium]
MDFEWDDQKNQANIVKHGISFDLAIAVFEGSHVIKKSPYLPEERYMVTGTVLDRRITVIYTKRGGKVRIISARRAKKNE